MQREIETQLYLRLRNYLIEWLSKVKEKIGRKGEEFMENLKNKDKHLKVLTEQEAATQRSMQEANAKSERIRAQVGTSRKLKNCKSKK